MGNPLKEKGKMTTTATVTPTANTSVVATSVPTSHPGFDKFINIIAALEPVILAGASPFIKNPNTGALIAAESPIAQALLEALGTL